MRLLLWALPPLLAFGLGLAAAWVPRQPSPTSSEVEQLRASERRLQMQVSTLQARLRAREARNAVPPPTMSAQAPEAPPAQEKVAPAPDVDARAVRAGAARPEPAAERSAPATGAPAARPATVEAALERFYRYLEDTSASGAAGRRQKLQQLADDLRRMGNAGHEALLRVLAGGTSMEERRTAAQLLSDMQVPQALPLLQDILDREGDLLLRRAAASGLRRLHMPETIPTLEALLANPAEDRFVRLSAAAGLAQMGKAQGVTGLEQLFDESTMDGRGREAAFRAVMALNDERALPFMRRIVTSDAEVSYRIQAIRFLTGKADREALSSLQQVMHSPTEQRSVKEAAAQAYAVIAAK